MPNAGNSSAFKYVFWGIVILFVMGTAGQVLYLAVGGLCPIWRFMGVGDFGHRVWTGPLWTTRLVGTMGPVFVTSLLWIGIVGSIVYKDAKKRGMDPWLWATIAVFVPFFIGIIVYLVVRSDGIVTCENCGRPLRSDYRVCPYCGHSRARQCPQCGRPVSPEWKICPYCEARLAPKEPA